MKQKIRFILCGMLILATLIGSVYAATFSDVSKSASYAEAVDYVSSTGLMVGYGDGKFKPEKAVTRAEMATVLCKLLGEEKNLKKDGSKFKDVPTSHWGNAYVAKAASLGILSGYGNGKFGPDDTVTYEQAVTMIVNALGHGKAAGNYGGYPDGYVTIAKTIGLLNNANGKIGKHQTRVNVATMLMNCEKTPVVMGDGTYWHFSFGYSTGTQYIAKVNLDGTILAYSYGSTDYFDWTYRVENETLYLSYGDTAFSAYKDGFRSTEKYPMQSFYDYYTITPAATEDGEQFFKDYEPAKPVPEEGSKDKGKPAPVYSSLADGTYDARVYADGVDTAGNKQKIAIKTYLDASDTTIRSLKAGSKLTIQGLSFTVKSMKYSSDRREISFNNGEHYCYYIESENIWRFVDIDDPVDYRPITAVSEPYMLPLSEDVVLIDHHTPIELGWAENVYGQKYNKTALDETSKIFRLYSLSDYFDFFGGEDWAPATVTVSDGKITKVVIYYHL